VPIKNTPRTAGFRIRTVDVTQIGRELGVRYVLEGSLRKSSNRIRVTAQLVEAERTPIAGLLQLAAKPVRSRKQGQRWRRANCLVV
jgi:hypothetical protein